MVSAIPTAISAARWWLARCCAPGMLGRTPVPRFTLPTPAQAAGQDAKLGVICTLYLFMTAYKPMRSIAVRKTCDPSFCQLRMLDTNPLIDAAKAGCARYAATSASYLHGIIQWQSDPNSYGPDKRQGAMPKLMLSTTLSPPVLACR